MRRMPAWIAALLLCLSSYAHSFSFNSYLFAIYEQPLGGGAATIYVVPKPSVLIIAAEIDIPITFMPQGGFILDLECC